jgi:hypothetical protein
VCVVYSGLSEMSHAMFCSLKWVPLYKQGPAQPLIPISFQTGQRMRYSPLYCVYTTRRTICHDDKTINLHFSAFLRAAEIHFKVFPLFTTNRISKHSSRGIFSNNPYSLYLCISFRLAFMCDAEQKHCEYMIYFNIFTNVHVQGDKKNVLYVF